MGGEYSPIILVADDILSGRVALPSREGGVLGDQELDLLGDDIVVVFSNGMRKEFLADDNIAIEPLLSTIQLYHDASRGLHGVTPTHVSPAGYISVNQGMYYFRYDDLRKPGTVLPQKIFMIDANVSPIILLSKSVVITFGQKGNMTFEGHSLSVDELYSTCDLYAERVADVAKKNRWGLVSCIELNENSFGEERESRQNTITFKLHRLLLGLSILPVRRDGNKILLSKDIIILCGDEEFPFREGTDIEQLWNRWPNNNLTGTSLYELGTGDEHVLTYKLEDILSGKVTIPAVGGEVLAAGVDIVMPDNGSVHYEPNESLVKVFGELQGYLRNMDPAAHSYKIYRTDSAGMVHLVTPELYFSNIDEFNKYPHRMGQVDRPGVISIHWSVKPLEFFPGDTVKNIQMGYNDKIKLIRTNVGRTASDIYSCYRKRLRK